MEHLAHFGLSCDPFADDPFTDVRFETRTQEEAARRVLRGIQQGRGLVLLTGPVGSGKTTVLRRLLEELDDEIWEVALLVPAPGISDAAWVMSRFAGQLGVVEPASALLPLLAQLYERLVALCEEGRRVALVIDEAQGLAGHETVEMLRGLLNLEHEERRLLTLVLAGHPQVSEMLARDPGLAERVDVRVVLGGLPADESLDYLDHRLTAAGASIALFDSSAGKALASLTQGLPRKLNAVADNALFEACLAGHSRVELTDVVRAARDLGLDEGAAPPPEPTDPCPSAPEPVEAATSGATGEPPPLAELPQNDEIDIAFDELIGS